MDWDAEVFLAKLRAGGFDGSLNEELGRLSPEQLQAVEDLIKRKNQEAGSSEDP
jgi:hypothetical protein